MHQQRYDKSTKTNMFSIFKKRKTVSADISHADDDFSEKATNLSLPPSRLKSVSEKEKKQKRKYHNQCTCRDIKRGSMHWHPGKNMEVVEDLLYPTLVSLCEHFALMNTRSYVVSLCRDDKFDTLIKHLNLATRNKSRKMVDVTKPNFLNVFSVIPIDYLSDNLENDDLFVEIALLSSVFKSVFIHWSSRISEPPYAALRLYWEEKRKHAKFNKTMSLADFNVKLAKLKVRIQKLKAVLDSYGVNSILYDTVNSSISSVIYYLSIEILDVFKFNFHEGFKFDCSFMLDYYSLQDGRFRDETEMDGFYSLLSQGKVQLEALTDEYCTDYYLSCLKDRRGMKFPGTASESHPPPKKTIGGSCVQYSQTMCPLFAQVDRCLDSLEGEAFETQKGNENKDTHCKSTGNIILDLYHRGVTLSHMYRLLQCVNVPTCLLRNALDASVVTLRSTVNKVYGQDIMDTHEGKQRHNNYRMALILIERLISQNNPGLILTRDEILTLLKYGSTTSAHFFQHPFVYQCITSDTNMSISVTSKLLKYTRERGILTVADIRQLVRHILSTETQGGASSTCSSHQFRQTFLSCFLNEYEWIADIWIDRGDNLLSCVARDRNATELYKRGILMNKRVLANINAPSLDDGLTPLMIAAAYCDESRADFVVCMIEKGAKPEITSAEGENLFHRAAASNNHRLVTEIKRLGERRGHCELYKTIHNKLRAMINQRRDCDNATPLMLAVARGHYGFAAVFNFVFEPLLNLPMGNSSFMRMSEYFFLIGKVPQVTFLHTVGLVLDPLRLYNKFKENRDMDVITAAEECMGTGLRHHGRPPVYQQAYFFAGPSYGHFKSGNKGQIEPVFDPKSVDQCSICVVSPENINKLFRDGTVIHPKDKVQHELYKQYTKASSLDRVPVCYEKYNMAHEGCHICYNPYLFDDRVIKTRLVRTDCNHFYCLECLGHFEPGWVCPYCRRIGVERDISPGVGYNYETGVSALDKEEVNIDKSKVKIIKWKLTVSGSYNFWCEKTEKWYNEEEHVLYLTRLHNLKTKNDSVITFI